ncbi:hypothetical protein V1525DRAFT_37386 [Lipomyces kononenkoae]|uniref:Uncharacterized protein n=1 Tax=Lipomyces kononenkoae TaxID=34357 RepID=A0ACC3T698_LIPKO
MARMQTLATGPLIILQVLLSMVLVEAVPLLNGRSMGVIGDPWNSTLNIVPSNTTNATIFYTNAFQISVEAQSPSVSMHVVATVNPLTPDASKIDSSNVTYQGILQVYTANSSIALNAGNIAFISCDDPSSVSRAVIRAAEQHPSCILLYSTNARTCVFASSYQLYSGDLGAVFSTRSASFGRELLYSTNNNPGSLMASVVVNETMINMQASTSTEIAMPTTTTTTATIETSQVSNLPTTTSSGFTTWTTLPVSSPSSSGSQTSQSSGHTTTVAMIILYSVTGVVSGFFLLLIILGAIRAHRHPERYRVTVNPDGTVQRTTRARGLAKAVLDSIPLVKVPESRHHRQSDDTIERTEDARNNIKMVDLHTGADREGSQENNEVQPKPEQQNQSDAVPDAVPTDEERPNSPVSNSSTISLSSTLMIPTNGCTICFEPFLPGEDLRVLPCHHGFHAACVDPWLLNSSSQCPLCRVDLNLRSGAEIPDMPPGLMPDGAEGRLDSAVSGNALNTTLNRFLDMWNAQLLPRDERRLALERFREEDRIRREMRRRRQEHMDSEAGGHGAWRRFVEGRRRLFNLQQQRERPEAEQEQGQNTEQEAGPHENGPSLVVPSTSQTGQESGHQ